MLGHCWRGAGSTGAGGGWRSSFALLRDVSLRKKMVAVPDGSLRFVGEDRFAGAAGRPVTVLRFSSYEVGDYKQVNTIEEL